MPKGYSNTSVQSSHTYGKDVGPEECDLMNLPREITDALMSYERVAAPVFGNTTTIEATASQKAVENSHASFIDCDIFFDCVQDFHLELPPTKDVGVRAETTVHIHSDEAHQNDAAQLRRRVSPWTQRASFQSVRHGVGAVLRRASGSSSRISNPSSEPSHTPSITFSRDSSNQHSIDESASFRSFLDHAFEPDIVEEPADCPVDLLPELKPTPTRLERLAQREAAKAARKAERTLRKTASAGNLSQRHHDREQKSLHQTQKEFHGFMGSDFVY